MAGRGVNGYHTPSRKRRPFPEAGDGLLIMAMTPAAGTTGLDSKGVLGPLAPELRLQ